MERFRRFAVVMCPLLAVAACAVPGRHPESGKSPISSARTVSAPPEVARAVDVLRLARQRTVDARSAEVKSAVHSGIVMTTVSTGSIDWHGRFSGAMDITFTGGVVAESNRRAGLSQTGMIRSLLDALYVGTPTLVPDLRGRHWTKYEPKDMGKVAGGTVILMNNQVRDLDPVLALDALLLSGDIRQVGAQVVGGLSTTHYTGALSLGRIRGGTVSGLDSARVAQVRQHMREAGMTSEKIGIWVSAQGLPVRADVSGESSNGAFESSTLYTDYGKPVHVQAPALSDTMDYADRAKSG